MDRRNAAVGLCARCADCRPVYNTRGATFYLCHRAESDPAFVRYPRLPVVHCTGFTPSDEPPVRTALAR